MCIRDRAWGDNQRRRATAAAAWGDQDRHRTGAWGDNQRRAEWAWGDNQRRAAAAARHSPVSTCLGVPPRLLRRCSADRLGIGSTPLD
eukprot:scaffold11793_cov18-Phaeocystis_antarctica.AAC.1